MNQESFLKRIQKASEEKKLTAVAAENLTRWLTHPEFSEFHEALRAMIENGEFGKLNDCFYTIVPFGTGGRRGPVGVGPNRINFRTIGESAQGVVNYLSRLDGTEKSKKAVIAHDTRHYSKEFTIRTAEIMAGNGFSVYIFEDYRSTPELSFAVRELEADVGFVISASHNPRTDNGIKVYWRDGGQVVHPHDLNIIDAGTKVAEIKRLPLDKAQEQGLIHWIGREIDEKYRSAVCGEALPPPGNDVSIVYTPLHGVGMTSVLPVLQHFGYRVHVVEEQQEPSGDFPNVPGNIPNPEEPGALELAISKARALQADLVVATDPDADRLGVAVPVSDDKENWVPLTGNQIASLLTHFILDQLQQKNAIPENGLVVKTAVTTDLMTDICRSFGVSVKGDLLVGFKFIAEIIDQDPERFIFGAEESHGALKGSYTRDKDGAVAILLMAELAGLLKKEGKTPCGLLDELYGKHGYYKDMLDFIFFEGEKGTRQIAQIMEGLRAHPPTETGGVKVLEVQDYLQRHVLDMSTGEKRPLDVPEGDILIFTLSEDGRTRVAIRPSGTEPKMKFYISVYSEVGDDLVETRETVDASAADITKDIVQTARAMVEGRE